MKKKDLIQYVLLVLVGFVVVLGLLNFFRMPKNLGDALKNLDSAKKKIDSSMVLIMEQKMTIDSIRNSNIQLLNNIADMEKNYEQIRTDMNKKFNTTFFYLKSIKDTVNSLSVVGNGFE